MYVSVHATNPELRVRLLKNDRAGLILDQLRFLLDGGLEVHAQAVLCPEWNDGDELDRTIRELYALGEGVLSLSVVPVGLTRYNLNRPVRLLRADEAETAVKQTESIRGRALAERGKHWCYAADELFLIAGREMPGAAYYDDWPLLENGVGALRSLLDGFERGKGRLAPVEGVERVSHDLVTIGDVSGHRIIWKQVAEDGREFMGDRLVVKDGISSVVYRVNLWCAVGCYQANAASIDEIMGTFTVEG